MTPAEVIRDFKTKYLNTFVHLKQPDGREFLCKVDAIQDNRDRQAVIQLSSLEHGKVVINFASDYELKFKFPNSGSFQFGKDSYFIHRRAPHRQYARGCNAANHFIGRCTRVVPNGDEPDPTWTLELVEAAFKPEKFRGSDAVALLKRGKHRSVALSGFFSLTQPMDVTGNFCVFLQHTMIGHAKEDLSFIPARGAEVLTESATQALLEI